MNLLKQTAITFFITTSCYAQNIDSIQKKFATKVCNCIGEVKKYEELKSKIEICYGHNNEFYF